MFVLFSAQHRRSVSGFYLSHFNKTSRCLLVHPGPPFARTLTCCIIEAPILVLIYAGSESAMQTHLRSSVSHWKGWCRNTLSGLPTVPFLHKYWHLRMGSPSPLPFPSLLLTGFVMNYNQSSTVRVLLKTGTMPWNWDRLIPSAYRWAQKRSLRKSLSVFLPQGLLTLFCTCLLAHGF